MGFNCFSVGFFGMILSQFPKSTWTKNWVLTCGVTFCSFYGDLYENEFPKKLGIGFQNTVYAYENGVSTQYLLADEQQKVVSFIVSKIEKDVSLGRLYCSQVKEQTDCIMELMDELESKSQLELDDLFQLQHALYAHVSPNFAVKRTADYLSAQTLKILFSDLEKTRLYAEPVYVRVEQIIQRFIQQIAKKENRGEPLLRTMTFQELVDYFKTSCLPTPRVLEERANGVAVWYHSGQIDMFTGNDFLQLKKQLEKPFLQDAVNGKMAFPGRAKGTVRIILDPHRFKEFNEGDILVTGMTRPEFLPLMQKAAAFVTDAGGVLSHAAIVAREMKKPCVVGTTNATQFFKDGDRAEVDATKGIIRKLKNSFSESDANKQKNEY